MNIPLRSTVETIIKGVFPHAALEAVATLDGGRSNANFRVRLADGSELVLRFYTRAQHACRTETRVLRLLRDTVPVPRIIHASPDALPHAYIVYAFIPGTTLRELKRRGDRNAIRTAAFEIGATLARVGAFSFDEGSAFRPDPSIGFNPTERGAQAFSRYVAACARSPTFCKRIGGEAVDALQRAADAWAADLRGAFSDRTLAHGDFSLTNILVDSDGRVSALLDWEFACAASPLIDIGHFLRYEDERSPLVEPHFSTGFRHAGGSLPDNWRALTCIVDLAAIVGGLTKADLPAGAAVELRGLLHATLSAHPKP